jgi:hypothetical protein
LGEIPIKWKFTTAGTEEVKAKLNEVNRLLNTQNVDVKELDKAKRDYKRTVNEVVRAHTLEKNTFLALHPNLLKVSRAMSTLNSVFRAGMAVSQTLNLMLLRQNSTSSLIADKTLKVEQAQRDYNNAVRDFGPESDIARQKLNELNIALAEQQESLSQEKMQGWQNLIDIISSVGTVVATTFTALTSNPKITSAIWNAASKAGKLFGGIFTGVSSAIMVTGQWISDLFASKGITKALFTSGTKSGTLFGGIFTGAALLAIGTTMFAGLDILLEKLLGYSPIKKIVKDTAGRDVQSPGEMVGVTKPYESSTISDAMRQHVQWKQITDNISNFFKPITDLFNFGLPEAFGETSSSFNDVIGEQMLESSESTGLAFQEGWKSTWDGIINLFNSAGSSITSGTNQVFKTLIEHMNRLISAYNRAAKKLGKSTISTIGFSSATWTDIPTIAAANGFNGMVNSPTMFLTGEAGPEHVSVTPRGKSNGSGNIIVVNIAGSVISENELYRKFDEKLKSELRRRNFRML